MSIHVDIAKNRHVNLKGDNTSIIKEKHHFAVIVYTIRFSCVLSIYIDNNVYILSMKVTIFTETASKVLIMCFW